MFKSYNLYLSAGTLCGGILKLSKYLEPLFRLIVIYNKAQKYRHFDETTLKVFVDIPDKKTKNWWLWQSSTEHSVVFFLNRSRSANVVEDFLKDCNKDTVLITDRYSAYKKAKKKALAFCWVHVRRDFIKIGRSEFYHLSWALRWLKKIGKLFKYNKDRQLNKGDPLKYKAAQAKVEKQLVEIKAAAEYELNTCQSTYYKQRTKVIESLIRHWEGLTLFVNDDNIAMDNNFAERLFRPVATFRKSSYGTHSERFGDITAMLMSIFGTLRLNNIRAREYLKEYFVAAAASSADLDSVVGEFMPWNLPEEKIKRLTYS
jgi:transposase